MALVNGKWNGVNDNTIAGVKAASVPVDPYGYTEDGLAFLKGNSDSEINAINQQRLWDREDLIRKIGENREDFSMDRLVSAAKRNGINPVLLLDAFNGNTTGQAASYTTSAAKANSYDTNAKTDSANTAKVVGALLAALGMMIAAAI